MNKFLLLVVTLMVTLFAANSLAYTPPPAPANGWYVVDQAGKMNSDQIEKLNKKIERISKATKNEFGVLLLQDMGGENIEDVANTTYKTWGVGKRGLDNGCLIVVAIKERKSRIENGKGVEGEVTDLQANDILKKNLNPHLKSGDFYGAFDSTLDALSGLMESRINQKADAPAAPVVTAQATETKSGVSAFTIFILVLGVGVLAGIVFFLVGHAADRRRRDEQEALEHELECKRRNDAHLLEVRLRKERMEREDRERALRMPTPATPPVSRGSFVSEFKKPSTMKPTTVVSASAASLAAERAANEAAAARREREAADRRRREREDDDRRRRDDSSSSSAGSSSSSWDSGSSSSGGGFGGGDSGGGGSSSDW